MQCERDSEESTCSAAADGLLCPACKRNDLAGQTPLYVHLTAWVTAPGVQLQVGDSEDRNASDEQPACRDELLPVATQMLRCLAECVPATRARTLTRLRLDLLFL